MSTDTAVAAVKHAPVAPSAADRDHIVLSAHEVAAAYDAAISDPRLAIDLWRGARADDPRVQARRALAAEVALKHGLGLPSVTHATTVVTRRPSPVVGRDEHGNKVVEVDSSTGGFRAAFVEREDGSDVHPMVCLDVDCEMDERHFAVMVAYLSELVREMDPTGSLRFAGERAVASS